MNHESVSCEKMLQVDGLTKRFGAQPVIDGLSFTLRKGDRLAVSAPSGSGKTTLIRILSGLEEADGGSFSLEAENPVTVFQEPRLFPYMTVEENALLPLKMRRRPRAGQVMERYEEWLALCGLAPHRHRYPHELSGGMKQKVALVRGFITDPDLVMLDEPFKSIDAAAKADIIEQILQRHAGATLLLITHDAEEARKLARSALVFSGGPLAGRTLRRAVLPRCSDERRDVPTGHALPYGCPLEFRRN